MIRRLRYLLRGPVARRRLCDAGLHGDLIEVRLHAPDCTFRGCPGSHPAMRCPVCGATWDLLPDPVAGEALR